MASFRSFALTVAAIAVTVAGQSDGPTLDEYKEGKADDKAKVEAVANKQAKMSAVDKVIVMLDSLKTQVISEGEAEAASYNKFSCFCKDTTSEKTAAIQKGTDDKAELEANIAQYQTERDTLDQTIQTLLDTIKSVEKDMKEARVARAATLKVFTTNAADLAAALEALEGAIASLKASKSPSLAQLKSVQNTVRTAVMLADALGLGGASTKKAASLFLQADPNNEVPMEDYKFHSNSIIETLEQLLKDFQGEKNEVDAAEVKSTKEFDMLMQEKTDVLKAKNLELDDTRKAKATKIAEIATASEQLTTVAAILLDDQDYLKELAKMCSEKAQTWDQRSAVRRDEISALTSAVDIIKSTVSEKTSAKTVRLAQRAVSVRLAEAVAKDADSMENIEAEAEASDPALIQRTEAKHGFLRRIQAAGPNDDGRDLIVSLLKSQGNKLHSTLLTALASQISTDPFAKVKVLIQELIERLLSESANEANQKGWCDKALSDAHQKRDYAAKEVRELNGAMATYEARRDKLTESISVLTDEIKDLKEKRAEAQKMRDEEKAENAATVTEAEEGLAAVNQASDILSKYYRTAAKSKVEYSQLQAPVDDAPDAGFDNGEAYTGSQGTAGGILGMLDVIKSDFERTVSETEKAEAEAEQAHLEFMTETGMSLAKKSEAKKAQQSQLDDTAQKLADADENLKLQSTNLNNKIKELLDLQPTCIDTGMTYDERVSRREDEITSLNKALCILERYAEFGPEGASTGC